MAITYNEVRNDRQWKASTGLSEEQFFKLVKMFSEAYERLFGVSMADRQSNSTNESTFKTYEDLLFFSLYSLKIGVGGIGACRQWKRYGLRRGACHRDEGHAQTSAKVFGGSGLQRRVHDDMRGTTWGQGRDFFQTAEHPRLRAAQVEMGQ